MKKLMFAAVAALAMVGVANAAPSYNIDAAPSVSPCATYDTDPGDDHSGWYSSYVMNQEDAQKAMGTTETVTYSDMATWLGENFADNRKSVIDNAQEIEFNSYGSGQYRFLFIGESVGSDLQSAIGVFFYDDNENVAYNVMPGIIESMFYFNDSVMAGSGWQAASVPEPTSAMLLLLGVAGLALKRKRA